LYRKGSYMELKAFYLEPKEFHVKPKRVLWGQPKNPFESLLSKIVEGEKKSCVSETVYGDV
ncbi:hypothetical protein, partial [Escherichia coli]|uniref:hypothetical protein n=1 Tax=Escherichia coli TaxID=562 RepID=UPI001F24C0D2